MGGEPDDGVRSQDAAGQGGGGVVLADVDTVGADLEGEVGTVVEDERHVMLGADPGGETASLDDVPSLEVLVPQLHDVHPPGDARCQERGEVGAVSRAQVQAPSGQPPRVGSVQRFPAAAALRVRLGVFLVAPFDVFDPAAFLVDLVVAAVALVDDRRAFFLGSPALSDDALALLAAFRACLNARTLFERFDVGDICHGAEAAGIAEGAY